MYSLFYWKIKSVYLYHVVLDVCNAYSPSLEHIKRLAKAQLANDVRRHGQKPVKDVGGLALLHLLLHALDGQAHLCLDDGQVLLQAGLGHFRRKKPPLPLVDLDVAGAEDADLPVGQLVVELSLEVLALDPVHLPRGGQILEAGLGRTDANDGAWRRGNTG